MFLTTGARKKKSLTDRIDILPFPKQTLRKEKEKEREIKSNVTQEPKIPYVALNKEVETVLLKVPTGAKPSPMISIQQIIEEEKEAKSRIPAKSIRELYSLDQLKMSWKRYAFQMKEQGMETFFQAMMRKDPIHEEREKVVLHLENQVQLEYIRPILQDLVTYLRTNLKNDFIEVELEVQIDPNAKSNIPITGKDKFTALARKNPNLHTLKNTFNLDIEY